MLATRWPGLLHALDDMLKVFALFVDIDDELNTHVPINMPGVSRVLAIRDLFRWCHRASLLLQHHASQYIPSTIREGLLYLFHHHHHHFISLSLSLSLR